MKKACLVCNSTDVTEFVEISQLPIFCNLLLPTRDEAINATKGDIRLGFCGHCGHIFNTTFNPDLIKYNENYENCLHFSPRFHSYVSSLAASLVKKHNLHNKEIIEIGCGNGDFLTLLCEFGGNRGYGFDPSYSHKQSEYAVKNNVHFIQDFFSERYGAYKPDLICCRHVLEHISSPSLYLLNLRNTIGNYQKTVFFFEVPNVLFIFRDMSIWDIIYEHCSYFSSQSVAWLFNTGGFTVTDITESFEGQFLCIEAKQRKGICSPVSHNGIEKLRRYISEFATNYMNKTTIWNHRIEQILKNGEKVVVWGAGSKGVTFLNTIQQKNYINYVVDINPRKQNMFIATTAQQIMPPSFLKEYRPDTILVMNPIYKDEINQIINNMGLTTKIVIV